jgi:hypothetical protein
VKLGRKQEIFTQALALLLQFASFRGFDIRMGQVERSNDEAKRLGFERSNHTLRLAADLNLFRAGKFLTRSEDHRMLGEFWEGLSGDYDGERLTFCWGGRFSRPDGNHYSIENKGTK